MTLADRAAAFNTRFPKHKAAHLHLVKEQGRDVIYGRWIIGAAYSNISRYYGSYPRVFLPRVLAIFPDVAPADTLHAFSGSLPKGAYTRLDVNPIVEPDVCGNVYDVESIFGGPSFVLIFADPPYSADDAVKYGTTMIDRRRTLAALATIAKPGGFLVFLDTTWPMHNKTQWVTVGRIVLVRSTNHRVRDISIFERVAA